MAAIEGVISAQIARRRGSAEADADGIRLTDDQTAALAAIRADLAQERPMNRLLQGDVGSGKTALAALALAFVADTGAQGALLAPTDLLARQHAQTLTSLLEPLGHDVTLLSGSMPATARREALELIAAPVDRSLEGRSRGRVVVGTHALVQEGVAFADLRLVVVDEQHRFGVAEREALAAKGRAPHVLLMTATPIPRTLGQIVHADLDVSDLRTPPQGRQKIVTGVRRTDELIRRGDGRPGALPLLVKEIAAGHRGFVVVPLVEEDADSGARSVGEAAEFVRENWSEAADVADLDVPVPAIEIVHGQMKAADRDAAMDRFRSRRGPAGRRHNRPGGGGRRAGSDGDADPRRRPIRRGPAPPAAWPGRSQRGGLVLRARLGALPGGSSRSTDEEAAVKARLDALVETNDGSSWPSSTSSSAARASCSA